MTCSRLCRVLLLAPLLLIAPWYRPAVAGVNPSVNWSVSFAPYASTPAEKDSIGHQLATHFDLMEVEPGNLDWPQYMRPYNPNFKFLRYDNISNNNHGGHRDKWIDMQNYCALHGYDFERLWCHFTLDSPVRIGPDQSYDDYIDRVDVSASGLTDMTYWAFGSDANTNVAFCRNVGDMVIAGHYDRFYALNIGLRQAASAGWNGAWEYLRSDSTWQTLAVNDSTAHMTVSGSVRFTPPSDWGFLTFDGLRHFWVRLRCTQAASTGPSWSWFRKGKYIAKDTVNNGYVIPGWDPANDVNGDGWVSDAEFASLANPGAHARLKCEARVPSFTLWLPRFAANVGDPVYREISAGWQVTQAQQGASGQQLDGIFEDNNIPSDGSITVMAGSWNLADSTAIGNYVPVTAPHIAEYPGPGPGRRYQQDYLGADSVAYLRLGAAGKWLEGNPSQFYGDNHLQQYDPLGVHTICKGDSGGYFAYAVHHGCVRETFLVPKQSIDSDGSPVVTSYVQFQMAKELTAHGRFAEFLFRASYADADYGAATMYKDRDQMYALTYFCMFSNANSYGSWTPSGAVAPAESTQWFPAVGYNFGTPQNDSTYVFQSGTDSNGEPYHVYARYFTNALVLVKPKPYWNSAYTETTSPQTPINLPVPLRRLNRDGTLGPQITQISLKNIEGAILVGSVPAPGGTPSSDTTPPGTINNGSALFSVMSVSPSGQALATTHNNIKVDLNDTIDPNSLVGGTVQVTGSVSGAHSGGLSAVGRYLTFTPTTPFTAGEVVTVRVAGNLRAMDGHVLDGDGDGSPGGDKVWSFTVGAY